MKKSLLLAALAALLFSSCESTPSEAPESVSVEEESADAIVTSFVFMGCNRIWWKDVQPNTSTANTDVLKNIFTHVANSGKQTDYFFFLGDIVTGEATDSVLNSQLYYWDEDYNNGVFSDFKSTGIKMIPVPGNHEMLNQNETPLAHTTDTWMKYMGKYMPADRDIVPDSPDDRMTYGFTHGNIGFIVLNTDTYNTINKIGLESQFPYEWTKKQVAKYKADPSIEHIFVMGHRPFYTNCLNYGTELLCPEGQPHECVRNTTHSGITTPEKSNPVWDAFEKNDVVSMLSAHVHQYQRLQPNGKTYQIVAGNGGSPLEDSIPPKFFGYTRINVWESGRIEMISEGYDAPARYDDPVADPQWSQRDMLNDMRWYIPGAKNDSECQCVTGE